MCGVRLPKWSKFLINLNTIGYYSPEVEALQGNAGSLILLLDVSLYTLLLPSVAHYHQHFLAVESVLNSI